MQDGRNDMPTLTPPNEWVSVEDAAPDPGERVLATDGIFVGEAYRSSANSWFRHTGFHWRDGVTGRTVRFWMPLPTPPDKDNNVLAKTPNEPMTLEQLREMDGEPVWVQTPGIPQYGRWVIVAGIDTNDGQKTLYCQGDYTCRNYGQDWLAYRRPPEGEEAGNG